MQYFQFYNIGLYDFSSVRNCSALIKLYYHTTKYKPETDMLAVNAERTQLYMQLNAQDLFSCRNAAGADVIFCTLHNPVYDLGDSRQCVIAMCRQGDDKAPWFKQGAFLNSLVQAREASRSWEMSPSCETRHHPTPSSVHLWRQLIDGGNWAANVYNDMFEKTSTGSETVPPTFRLRVEADREAYTDKMKFPSFFLLRVKTL